MEFEQDGNTANWCLVLTHLDSFTIILWIRYTMSLFHSTLVSDARTIRMLLRHNNTVRSIPTPPS